MNKVGIFGGSFDPIHLGHLITTQYVLEKRGLEKIIFIPCNISPLKSEQYSSPLHRLNMLKLAIENFPQFGFSNFEISKGDVSYSYDTLLEMKKLYKNIELIIGFDNLLVFDKWKNPDEIFELTNVIVMKRNDNGFEKSTNKYFDKAIILDTPAIDISSTEIRKRVQNNLTIDFFVPEKVKEYILENDLYKPVV